jgi:hypothetical protein
MLKRLLLSFLICFLFVPGAMANHTIRSGRYFVTIFSPPQGYFAGEESEISFRLVDTGSVVAETYAPLDGAKLRCVIDMPSMPSMPKIDQRAQFQGKDGIYVVRATFAHGGEFRVILSPEPGFTPKVDPFNAEFTLAVNDEEPSSSGFHSGPFSMDLTVNPETPLALKPANLLVRIQKTESAARDSSGVAIHPKRTPIKEFDVVHEKLMHLFIVRSDLAYFAHEHPTLTEDGSFQLSYAFPAPGEYRIFADTAPKGAGSHVVGGSLSVTCPSNASCNPATSLPPVIPLNFSWDSTSGLPAKKTFVLALSVTDRERKPVTDLQPYLGALAHLVLIHEDGFTFVHSHADELDLQNGKNGTIRFLTRLPKAGRYRAWAQVSRKGEVITGTTLLSTN